MQWPVKSKNKTFVVYTFLSLLSWLMLFSCSDNQETVETGPVSAQSESFTFFELGINTKLTEHIRKDLSKKLGRDAVEHRSILDLEINYPEFIKKYFPQIDALNRQLNFPPGERVEHNTVKLMYRYPQKRNSPFDYVELVFSDYTKTPLVFKIHFQKDESGIVDTLKAKYGPPRIIAWKEENGQSMFWQKNTDLLIVSRVPDRFGHHEFQIIIYFVQNLKQLIDIEIKEQEKIEQQRAKSGKTAF